jgi:hypothetical protein
MVFMYVSAALVTAAIGGLAFGPPGFILGSTVGVMVVAIYALGQK